MNLVLTLLVAGLEGDSLNDLQRFDAFLDVGDVFLKTTTLAKKVFAFSLLTNPKRSELLLEVYVFDVVSVLLLGLCLLITYASSCMQNFFVHMVGLLNLGSCAWNHD